VSTSLPEEAQRALLPHVARVWDRIRAEFGDREFKYEDLRSIGVWPEEASIVVSLLEERGLVSVVGLRTFRVLSGADIDGCDTANVRPDASPTTGVVSVSLSVDERYCDRLEDAARDFVRVTIPAFGSVLDTGREGSPVDIILYPTSGVVSVTFATVSATLAEIGGFQRWAELKAAEFGTIV
jgi:hypothetical protein